MYSLAEMVPFLNVSTCISLGNLSILISVCTIEICFYDCCHPSYPPCSHFQPFGQNNFLWFFLPHSVSKKIFPYLFQEISYGLYYALLLSQQMSIYGKVSPVPLPNITTKSCALNNCYFYLKPHSPDLFQLLVSNRFPS